MNNQIQINFTFPHHMGPIVKEIMEGEYQIDLNIKKPVICDIGANIGIFTLWALQRWPGCTIHCFEPSPSNFQFLAANFSHIPSVKLNNVALGNPNRTKLFKGRSNCGQSSFFHTDQQRDEYETVKTLSPKTLPQPCDILKIDTEGCEVEILSGLKDRVFKAILLEYHSEADRKKIINLLSDYALIETHRTWGDQGILKFIHR